MTPTALFGFAISALAAIATALLAAFSALEQKIPISPPGFAPYVEPPPKRRPFWRSRRLGDGA